MAVAAIVVVAHMQIAAYAVESGVQSLAYMVAVLSAVAAVGDVVGTALVYRELRSALHQHGPH